MAAGRQALGTTALILLALASPAREGQAQVGITSGLSRVTLVARSAPTGSVQAVMPARPIARVGGRVEAAVKVQLSTNSGYRLVALGLVSSRARVWVRDVKGDYRELKSSSPVTVAEGTDAAGHSAPEVQYQLEMGNAGEAGGPAPVRLELRVNPTM